MRHESWALRKCTTPVESTVHVDVGLDVHVIGKPELASAVSLKSALPNTYGEGGVDMVIV
jgi:hypothetical protein